MNGSTAPLLTTLLAASVLATGSTGCGFGGDVHASTLPDPVHYRPGDPSDPNQIRMAIRYVAYSGEDHSPTATAADVDRFLELANGIYAACSMRFVLEDYLIADPLPRGLPFGLSGMAQLDPTRTAFEQPNRLVVIETGDWNHNTMGPANAWTAMPGSLPAGAVVEAAIGTHPEIIAHELGHYLNLDHVTDARNLMNPIIYHSSTALSPGQCLAMRETAVSARAAAVR